MVMLLSGQEIQTPWYRSGLYYRQILLNACPKGAPPGIEILAKCTKLAEAVEAAKTQF
jgi:hypothetical protein